MVSLILCRDDFYTNTMYLMLSSIQSSYVHKHPQGFFVTVRAGTAYRHLFQRQENKNFNVYFERINGKFTVEYQMLNKEWVINEIFSEKAKKDSVKINFFGDLRSKIFGKFGD